jgi:predicted transcriptional regulator
MRVISTENHIVRKALNLSLVEMAVLCDIIQMSQNPKYEYWCVKSKKAIAKWIDISRDTVCVCLSSLEKKGLIFREINSATGLPSGRIKPTQFVYDLSTAQEYIAVYIKSNDIELVSAKIEEIKNLKDGVGDSYTGVGKSDMVVGNSYTNVSEIPTQDIHTDIQTKKKKECITEKEFSEDAEKFSEWFKTIASPATVKNVRPTVKRDWEETYDWLIGRDYTKEQIVAACKWARSDSFWADNFLSASKLKKLNKEGIRYIDLFLEKMQREATAKPKKAPDNPNESDDPIAGWKYNAATGKYMRPREEYGNN